MILFYLENLFDIKWMNTNGDSINLIYCIFNYNHSYF